MKAIIRVGERRHNVPPLLLGSFTELFGKMINGGLWDATRRVARPDVLAAMRSLRPACLRFPGGCAADDYHWRDGVGPARRHREKTFWSGMSSRGEDDLAARMGPPEPNTFGTDEFLAYCDDVGAVPALTANVGSGEPQEAADWVAYTDGRVKHWFVGNEIYGPWELGHMSAADYASRFREFSDAMRAVDPDLVLIACGVLTNDPASEWNDVVSAGAGECIDMWSLHYYFPGPTYPGRPSADDEIDYAQIASGSRHFADAFDTEASRRPGATFALDEWGLWFAAPELYETNYRLCDALYFAGMYNRMLERSDALQLGMHSYPVNTLGAIQTRGDDMFVTSAYLVQLLYRTHAGSAVVAADVEGPSFTAAPFPEERGRDRARRFSPIRNEEATQAPVVDAVATRGEGGLSVFLSNASIDTATGVRVTGAGPTATLRWITGDGPFDRNTVNEPSRLRISTRRVSLDGFELPPHTVGVLLADG